MTDPEVALAESMTFAIDDAQIAELRRRLDDARDGKIKLLTPLPRRVRLRLWARARIDRVAIWLIGHRCCWLAERAWRVEGIEWRRTSAFLDETPQAYKDIDVVMADAADLVEVRHTLRQIVNVKGE